MLVILDAFSARNEQGSVGRRGIRWMPDDRSQDHSYRHGRVLCVRRAAGRSSAPRQTCCGRLARESLRSSPACRRYVQNRFGALECSHESVADRSPSLIALPNLSA